MPIYEYRCGACGHELEALQKLADSPLKECPACGQGRLSKLVSAAGFRLKGSGWYATDFKNRAKPAEKNNGAKGKAEPAAAAATDTATTPASGGESTAESTPASGGESKAGSTPASGGGDGSRLCH
jgi:putative FmdB family regulatory protein